MRSRNLGVDLPKLYVGDPLTALLPIGVRLKPLSSEFETMAEVVSCVMGSASTAGSKTIDIIWRQCMMNLIFGNERL